MTKVLIEVDVAYPKQFFEILESQAPARKNGGELGCLFYGVDESAHNRVFVAFNWSSVASAEDFWQSDMARSHMDAWNSTASPGVVILRNSCSARIESEIEKQKGHEI